jgi:hypothetical protein
LNRRCHLIFGPCHHRRPLASTIQPNRNPKLDTRLGWPVC